MPSDTAAVLRDVAHHIDLAMQFAAGIEYEAFQNDTRTVFAVIRCLEIISEASRRLPDELKARHPSIPWKDIAGAGNVYRHNYEDVAPNLVWDSWRCLPCRPWSRKKSCGLVAQHAVAEAHAYLRDFAARLESCPFKASSVVVSHVSKARHRAPIFLRQIPTWPGRRLVAGAGADLG